MWFYWICEQKKQYNFHDLSFSVMKMFSIIIKEKDGKHQRGFVVLEISVWLYLNHFHHTSVTALQTLWMTQVGQNLYNDSI